MLQKIALNKERCLVRYFHVYVTFHEEHVCCHDRVIEDISVAGRVDSVTPGNVIIHVTHASRDYLQICTYVDM